MDEDTWDDLDPPGLNWREEYADLAAHVFKWQEALRNYTQTGNNYQKQWLDTVNEILAWNHSWKLDEDDDEDKDES